MGVRYKDWETNEEWFAYRNNDANHVPAKQSISWIMGLIGRRRKKKRSGLAWYHGGGKKKYVDITK